MSDYRPSCGAWPDMPEAMRGGTVDEPRTDARTLRFDGRQYQ